MATRVQKISTAQTATARAKSDEFRGLEYLREDIKISGLDDAFLTHCWAVALGLSIARGAPVTDLARRRLRPWKWDSRKKFLWPWHSSAEQCSRQATSVSRSVGATLLGPLGELLPGSGRSIRCRE